jgi:hypothetical protein
MHASCDFDGTLIIHKQVQGAEYKLETNLALPSEERQRIFTVRPGPAEHSYEIQFNRFVRVVWYDQPRTRRK